MAAVMRARDRVVSSRLSLLSADEVSTPGVPSEHLLQASGFDNGGVQSLWAACAATAVPISVRSKNDGGHH